MTVTRPFSARLAGLFAVAVLAASSLGAGVARPPATVSARTKPHDDGDLLMATGAAPTSLTAPIGSTKGWVAGAGGVEPARGA